MTELIRCEWCLKDALYMAYHDHEWGFPSYNDQHLFEHLILETFQAGLSWHTILRKRESFRAAFHQFDALRIARYGESDIQRLMADASIIRNRQKIVAAINNATRYLEVVDRSGSFSDYMWQFTCGQVLEHQIQSLSDLPVSSPQSDAMSRTMKQDGFKFVGTTTCYAFMQAVGMVNDHVNGCWRRRAGGESGLL